MAVGVVGIGVYSSYTRVLIWDGLGDDAIIEISRHIRK